MSSIDNLTGQTLGKCQLRELLGMGEMGAVYRGHQAHLGRMVAVKVLPPTQVPGYVECFNREAAAAAALEHQHIVPLYHYGIENGISYIVMRLLTGGTLSERMAQASTAQPLLPSLSEVGELLKQVASALDYAHQRGVVHGDIKPSNIMFDNEGLAYVVDFGIANLRSMLPALTPSGMPVYMAPEQRQAGELTGAVDQYALGALAYQLITGREPLAAPLPAHQVRGDVPEMVSNVLARALAHAPEDRFSSVGSFAKAFVAAVQNEPILSTGFFTVPLSPLPPVPLSPPPAPPAEVNPALWFIGLGLIFGSVMLLLVLVLSLVL